MLSATTIGAFLLLAAAHDARGEYMGGVWPPGATGVKGKRPALSLQMETGEMKR